MPEKVIASTEKEYTLIREILAGKPVSSADRYLVQKRICKSEEDIAKIQKAIQITEKIYDYIRQNTQPDMYEYEIEAMISCQFKLNRGTEAFPSIVASGPNACIIHYTANNRKIEK